ncbi:hypothetical protein EfmAA610_26680 [Enterococcus faecium]|nr:hypothetical protein EfmAA610_26680 [Enterococcus faecium]
MYRLALEEKLQVITIEDPVEIEEPFFLQLQINPKIAQTYDTLLKLALRVEKIIIIIFVQDTLADQLLVFLLVH